MTDFNIATRLQKDSLACSMSGTKPYMAPEVFMCALEEVGKCKLSQTMQGVPLHPANQIMAGTAGGSGRK